MIRHPKGENTTFQLFHSPLIIPRVPETFANIKCGRGLAKDFTTLHDFHTRSYEENLFLKMHQMTNFQGERSMIPVELLGACKDLVQGNQVVKCDVTVCQTLHVFSESPGI